MSVKTELGRCLEQFELLNFRINGRLPETCLVEGALPDIYRIETLRKGEYVQWKYREMCRIPVLGDLVARVGGKLNDSVAQYLTSYWFAELLAKFDDGGLIKMIPLLPGLELESFELVFSAFNKCYDSTDWLPVAKDGESDCNIFVNNLSGEVHVLNEWGYPIADNMVFLASDLESFLGRLSFEGLNL